MAYLTHIPESKPIFSSPKASQPKKSGSTNTPTLRELKTIAKTKPMKFEEFQTEIDWWGNEADGFASREENNQAWKVSIDEIIARI